MTTRKTSNQPKQQQQPSSSLLRLYIIVCAYRIINALLIQTQFDADEYWQCLEPAYCLAFSSDDGAGTTQYGCAYTWEWTRRFDDAGPTAVDGGNDGINFMHAWFQRVFYGPVRSFVPVAPTYALYVAAKWLGIDTPWMISRGPLMLNAIIVAAPTDVATVSIARWMGNNQTKQSEQTLVFGRLLLHEMSEAEWWALVASITSWFNGYALVRTYSNSMETMLLSVGIAFLAPELFGQNSTTKETHIRPASALAFILGGMSVCVRFTGVAAWIPVGLLCCAQKATLRGQIFTLFGLCASFGVLGVALGTVVDRVFYGFWAVPFLGSFHFNVVQGNGSLYGTHHPLWYIFAGLPAICGALLPFFIYDAVMIFRCEAKQGAAYQERRILVIIIAFYVGLHSLSAHKEFRFILPILPLVCALSAHGMAHYFIPQTEQVASGTASSTSQFTSWRRYIFCYFPLFLLNYPHLLFLASTHQAGSVAINKEIVARIGDMEARRSRDNASSKPSYEVHYLMGCHSTPLYSHLHMRGVRMKAWTLDCSPQCRADPDVTCESDRFHTGPHAFMKKVYSRRSQSIPDFLAIFEDSLVVDVQNMLSGMGLVEVARINHEIDSLRIANGIPTISYRHMVLYETKKHSAHRNSYMNE